MVQPNKVLELFGHSTRANPPQPWAEIVAESQCPFTKSKCFKVRKSTSEISIGTCSVRYGRRGDDILICPDRLLEKNQVFTDCIHLLTMHQPGNELHILSEVAIPGGSVDYFLASVKGGKVKDFVAIEFQTLDTTGTIWPERQRLLRSVGIPARLDKADAGKTFGMNWKMTAKTILVQLHHKVETLEHIGKHFALVIQDHLLKYLQSSFRLDNLRNGLIGDTFHIHAYRMHEVNGRFRITLDSRLSTDAAGVAECLNIQAQTRVELETIIAALEARITDATRFVIGSAPPPAHGVMPTE